MCGRFVQSRSAAELAARFGASILEDLPAPRYNVTPGTAILAVRADPGGARQVVRLH